MHMPHAIQTVMRDKREQVIQLYRDVCSCESVQECDAADTKQRGDCAIVSWSDVSIIHSFFEPEKSLDDSQYK